MGSTIMQLHVTAAFCGLNYDTRLYNKQLFKKQKTHLCTGSDPKSYFVAKLVLLSQKVASF